MPRQATVIPQSEFGTILIFLDLRKEPSGPLPYRDGTYLEGIYNYFKVPSRTAPYTITALRGSSFAKHICWRPSMYFFC